MKKATVIFCSSPDYSNHAKSLYNYIVKHHNNINICWVVMNEDNLVRLSDKNINCVLYGTDEYKKVINDADIYFTTHANLLHERKEHQIYVELWHGVGLKKTGFMIQNLTSSDEAWTENVSRNIDYLITPSDFWTPIFCSIFHIKPNRVLPIGYPVIHDVVTANGKENLARLLKCDVKKYKKIVYYMPTYRKSENASEDTKINYHNIFSFDSYDEKLILNYLEKNNILLCIKRHPYETIQYDDINHQNVRYITQEMMNENMFSVTDILNAGDLLITDYSAVGFEFVSLGKPVLYVDGDVDEYATKRGVIFGDYTFWTKDFRVSNIQQLIEKLDKLLKYNGTIESVSEQRRLYYNKTIEKEGGCEAIYQYFFNKDGSLKKNLKHHISKEQELKNEVDELTELHRSDSLLIKLQQQDIEEKQREITKILNSTSWKLISKVRKIKEILLFWKR